MSGTLIFNEVYPFNQGNSIDIGTGLGWQPVCGQLNEPNRVDALLITNTDAADHVVMFSIQNGGEFPVVAIVTVPAGAGTGVIPPFDALPAFPASLQGGIAFAANDALFAQVEVAMPGITYLAFAQIGGRL